MSKASFGIGLIGAWHTYMHKFARIIYHGFDKPNHWLTPMEFPEFKLISAWDNDIERGKSLAEECNIKFEADLDKLLADPAIDAVIICSPTAMHGQHILRAAQAGKHIFVEKSPFTSLSDAYLARDAVKKNNVHFMCSSPMEKPRNRYAKDLMDSGKLGEIFQVRYRLYDHFPSICAPTPIEEFKATKEELGGGALLDYGQHGIHIIHWFLGMPMRVMATMGEITDFAKKTNVEDNVNALFEYKSGVIGSIEHGWTSPDHECVLDVFGSKGRVHVAERKVYTADMKLTKYDDVTYMNYDEGGNTIQVPESDFPELILYPFCQFLENVRKDLPDTRQTIDDSVQWTEMIMGAYRSANTGEPITFRV